MVTIHPVVSKVAPLNTSTQGSVYSTTLTAMPSTIVATPAPGLILFPSRPSLPSTTKNIAVGPNLFPKQTKTAYSFNPHPMPNLSQTIVVGGHMFKQDGK